MSDDDLLPEHERVRAALADVPPASAGTNPASSPASANSSKAPLAQGPASRDRGARRESASTSAESRAGSGVEGSLSNMPTV